MRTSYSSLETYKQCPQKYKFQEVDKIRRKKSREAVFGTLIHETLKFMFVSDPLFPTLDQVLDHFREHFPETGSDLFGDDSERTTFFSEGVRMLKTFYGKNAPWNFSVLDLESHFEISLDDPNRDETHVLAGKIDRIDKLADGSYEIIDYKTAKRMPSQADIDENLQLSLYALGVQKKWPHIKPEQIKVSLYFLKHGEKLSSTRTANTLQSVETNVINTASEIRGKIERNEPFEPVVSALCDYCSYKPICPMWRHLYKKAAPAGVSSESIDGILREYFSLKKQGQSDKKRLSELQGQLKDYMQRENLGRLFSDDGVVAKSVQKRSTYVFETVRAILEPIGKWDIILSADEKKLKKIFQDLPTDAQAAILEKGIQTREFIMLKATLKKIKRPDASDPELPPLPEDTKAPF